jgi:hypothetical protein
MKRPPYHSNLHRPGWFLLALLFPAVLLAACTSVNLKVPGTRLGEIPRTGSGVTKADESHRIVYAVECDLCSVQFTVRADEPKTVEQVLGKWSETVRVRRELALVYLTIIPIDGKTIWSASIFIDGKRLAHQRWTEPPAEAVTLKAMMP